MFAAPPDTLVSFPSVLPSLDVLERSGEIDPLRTSSALARLIEAPRPEGPEWRLAMADLEWRNGETTVALRHAEVAATQSKAAGNAYLLQDALLLLCKMWLHTGRIARAEAAVAELDGFGYGLRENHVQARFSEADGWLLLRTGDLSNRMYFEAESRFRQAIRAAEALADLPARLRCTEGLASSLAATGHYPAAIEQLDLGLETCAREHAWDFVPRFLQARAFALRDLGFHPSADRHFSEALAWAEAVGDVNVQMRCLMGYAVLKSYDVSPAATEGLAEVESMLNRAAELAKKTEARSVATEIAFWGASFYEKMQMPELVEARMQEARQFENEGKNPDLDRIFANRRVERGEVEARREARFRSRTRETIESIPDALFVIDPVRGTDGQITDLINEYRNSAADRTAGCHSTDVRTLSQLRELEAFRELEEPILRAMESREIYSDEIRLSGEAETWLARRVVPVGEGVAVTMRDVTTHYAAEKALRDAAAQAREADRAKSEFLANMSHEIRTPINGVLGLARLLRDTSLDATQRRYVDGIASSADILLRVLGDVLDLSKIEAGRIDLRAEATPVRALIGDVVSLFHGQASERGLRLEAIVADEVPDWLMVDGPRLRQVLANLVGNAVKFTAEGYVRIVVSCSATNVRFEVIDTGPGLEQEDASAIFQAFRQGTTGQVHGGTGLGLTISRRIVELMDGRIGVMSHPGQGSSFWVEIPLHRTEAPSVPAVEGRTFDGARVLLVEDNAVNVIVATGLLEAAGCRVELAENGEEAVQLASTGDYKAIFMDVRLPGIDGLEATRRIRKSEEGHQRIPIIALTASALTDDRNECFEAGMDDYLGKPFTVESLHGVLTKWIKE